MRYLLYGVLLAFSAGVAQAKSQIVLHAVGLESQYANVMAQIGGPYVEVRAIEDNPNADPHEFELSPGVARLLHGADVVVANGLGYDSWADKLLAGGKATVISAQAVRHLPASTPNPHLWYSPATMPAVARAVAAAYAAKDPDHANAYWRNEQAFVASLTPWNKALAGIKAHYAGAKVAVSEPVADYLLQAAGLSIATPFSLQAAVMNGTDPAPQDVSAQQALLSTGKVRVFVYNQQVTDALTTSFRAIAHKAGLPVLGVYELMPPSAKTYQNWMLQTTRALAQALAARQ